MAANIPSAAQEDGIGGGRDRASNAALAAVYGRLVCAPGMDAALIGDTGLDNDWVRSEFDDRGAIAVILPKADRKTGIPCDFARYRWRHLIENVFCNSPQAFPPSCACWNLKPAPLK